MNNAERYGGRGVFREQVGCFDVLIENNSRFHSLDHLSCKYSRNSIEPCFTSAIGSSMAENAMGISCTTLQVAFL